MKHFIRRYRFVLMIVLLAQSMTLFFLFLSQLAHRRSLAEAFLAVSMSEAAATFLLYLGYLDDRREQRAIRTVREQMQEDPDGFDIPLDETARERDFR